MAIKTKHIVGIILGLIILLLDFYYFLGKPVFMAVLVVAITVGWINFWIDYIIKRRDEREYEARFVEFVRNLVGAVKSGMPASKAIIRVSDIDYGSLSPHIRKLSAKMEWSIPVHKALTSFAYETGNKVIKRAVATVIEAEQSGGNIEDVLEEITTSLIEIKKIKEKRVASIHSQVVQSYIIFFVFLGIMLIIQNILIPYLSGIQTQTTLVPGETITSGISGSVFSTAFQKVSIEFTSPEAFIISFISWLSSLYGIFLMMAVIQGIFAGLVIGKLSEGEVSAGIKHSIILATISLVIISLSQGF